MTFKYTNQFFYSLIVVVLFFGCKKDPKIIPNNNAPYYAGIPTVKIENYVNRLFIDLIGREALNTELKEESEFLRSNVLSISSRETLITKLQSDQTHRFGDSSYYFAYYNRFYELTKARILEGASDNDFYTTAGNILFQAKLDSLGGDSLNYRLNLGQAKLCYEAVKAKSDYMLDSITINQYYYKLVYNPIYDQINMNSFNFIRATFNDMFFRYPTTSEFNNAYDMVDKNKPNILFGISGQTKTNYINIVVNSIEFHEGMVRWLYHTFLSREPSYQEINETTRSFYGDKDVQKAQRNILKSDEYANF